MVLVHIGSVVVLTTVRHYQRVLWRKLWGGVDLPSETTTTGVLPVLANATVTGRDVAAVLPGLGQPRRHVCWWRGGEVVREELSSLKNRGGAGRRKFCCGQARNGITFRRLGAPKKARTSAFAASEIPGREAAVISHLL